MNVAIATNDDVETLAKLNHVLIQDEGHRNSMSVPELIERMRKWLQTSYTAALFTSHDHTVGYALWCKESEYIYIRHFFIASEFRGKGTGKQAFDLLNANYWANHRLRLDVLINNQRGIAFWKAVGFDSYCMTMEYSSA